MFLPDNVSACVDELERIASIIRKNATLSVAIASQTRLMIDITDANDEQRTAERLLSLARQWTRMDVRAGIGSSRALAESAVMHCRRGVAIDTRPAPADEPPLAVPAPVKGRLTLGTDCAANRQRLYGLVARLERLQEGFGQACREVRLRAVSPDMTLVRTLRFDRPVLVTDTLERVAAAVEAVPAGGDFVLELELGRPVPRSLVVRPREALAAAV
jgi:hypothetical protein